MKKKSAVIVPLLLSLTICLSGCGENVIPSMTDEQIKEIGEYTAITMMKYDANHRSRLVDIDDIAPVNNNMSIEPDLIKEPTGMDAVEENPIVDISDSSVDNTYTIEDVLELPQGVSLEYVQFAFLDSYPDVEGASFKISAAAGKKLLALRFQLKNETEQEQYLNLYQKAEYIIKVNDSYTRHALTTMLDDDLSTFQNTIAANETRNVVLLIETDLEIATELNSIVINLKNESKTYTINAF